MSFFKRRRRLASLLNYRVPGGGPAPVLANPAPRALRNSGITHVFSLVAAVISLSCFLLVDLGSGYCGGENGGQLAFFIIHTLSAAAGAVYLLLSTATRVQTEEYWGWFLFYVFVGAVAEFALFAWGCYLVFRALLHSPNACHVSGALVFFNVWSAGAVAMCLVAVLFLLSRVARCMAMQLAL